MFTRKDHKEWRDNGSSERRPPTPEDLAAEVGEEARGDAASAQRWWIDPSDGGPAIPPAPSGSGEPAPPTPEALGAVPVAPSGFGRGMGDGDDAGEPDEDAVPWDATPPGEASPPGAQAPWDNVSAPRRVPEAPVDLAALGAVMVAEGKGAAAPLTLGPESRTDLPAPDFTALRGPARDAPPPDGERDAAAQDVAPEPEPRLDPEPEAPPRPMIDAARFAETHGPRLRLGGGETSEPDAAAPPDGTVIAPPPAGAGDMAQDGSTGGAEDEAAEEGSAPAGPAWAHLPVPGDAKAAEDPPDGADDSPETPEAAETSGAEAAPPPMETAAGTDAGAEAETEGTTVGAGEETADRSAEGASAPPWSADRTVFATNIAAAFGAARREDPERAPDGATDGTDAPIVSPQADDAGELDLVAVPPRSAPLAPVPPIVADPIAEPERPGEGRRVVFAGAMCTLDPVSGAAISMRSVLEVLGEAGYAANSFTASIFDANGEVPFAPVLGAKAAEAESRGKLLRLERNDVEHWILLTKSSRGQQMNANEQRALIDRFKSWLDDAKPDLVLSYGTSALAKRMRADARAAGAQIAHYLANAEIDDKELILPGDKALCPSGYLAGLYRDRFGVEAEVLHPVIHGERSRREGLPVIADMPPLRKLGFVTFINPIPHKGLTLVARLVARAAKERPDLKFLVLEGRMPREALARMKVDLAGHPNVWWLPAQTDMASVYARTSVLLVPSFWAEGFGRAVIEAQLAGVPVLVGDRGGLPEALGGGGVVLPIPDRCVENHYAAPDEATINEWFETIVALWDDEETYADASALAREAAQRFSPEANRERVLSVIDRMFEGRAAANA